MYFGNFVVSRARLYFALFVFHCGLNVLIKMKQQWEMSPLQGKEVHQRVSVQVGSAKCHASIFDDRAWLVFALLYRFSGHENHSCDICELHRQSCNGFAYLNIKIFQTDSILINRHCVGRCSTRDKCIYSMPNMTCKCYPLECLHEVLVSLYKEFLKPRIELLQEHYFSSDSSLYFPSFCSVQCLMAFFFFFLPKLFQAGMGYFNKYFLITYYVLGHVLGFKCYGI